jgi:hypothetical protein
MDLFALGATLYEAVSGEVAFPTAEAEAGPNDLPQLSTDPVALRVAAPEVPEDLTAAIDALLAREPHDRPASALATLSLLASVLPPEQGSLWPDWVTEHMPDVRLGGHLSTLNRQAPQCGTGKTG